MGELEVAMKMMQKFNEVDALRKRVDELEQKVKDLSKKIVLKRAQEIETNILQEGKKEGLSYVAELTAYEFKKNPPKRR